jgi:putative ABC transport system substrate-binding protein
MKRREFIAGLGSAAAWPMAAQAQEVRRVYRIGYLSPGSPSPGPLARHDAFRQGLEELGYIEGKNIVVEYRFADGSFDRLDALASELVTLNVDVIVSIVTQASLAAKKATSRIPVVIVSVSDPIGSGLIASLARPGGNITGTSAVTADLAGKSLEVLKEGIPNASRVAVLWDPDNSVYQAQMLKETEVAAKALGLDLQTFARRNPDEIDSAFAMMSKGNVDALLVFADPVLAIYQSRIVDLANQNRFPAMYGLRESATAGGLMAFGPDYAAIFRRAAAYVDKILRGAKPADLPVEQPTKFLTIVNLKTAKALGFTFPTALLVRADEVIE